jgi:acetyl esterase/lipase
VTEANSVYADRVYADLVYADLVYAEIPGYRPLRLDLYVPAGEGPWPLVVWVHGGAWLTGDRKLLPETIAPLGFFERIQSRGYAVASVDYRLSAEATFPAQLDDVRAAIRWLRENAADRRLDPDRFATWGESAGGHLAAMAGLTADGREVHAVVDWYGVSDLAAMDSGDAGDPGTQLLGGTRSPEAVARASPVEHAHMDAPPFLCMHGTDDQVVPYSQSEHLAAVLHAYGVRCDLYPVPGADHVFGGAPDVAELVEASLDFLDDVLKPGHGAAVGSSGQA